MASARGTAWGGVMSSNVPGAGRWSQVPTTWGGAPPVPGEPESGKAPPFARLPPVAARPPAPVVDRPPLAVPPACPADAPPASPTSGELLDFSEEPHPPTAPRRATAD